MLISWKRFSPGYITKGGGGGGGRRYVSFRFEEKERRWYLRNKRSRLNALLAIRAINGASTLISCLRYTHPLPSPPTTVSVRHKHRGETSCALIDFRLPSPSFQPHRCVLATRFLIRSRISLDSLKRAFFFAAVKINRFFSIDPILGRILIIPIVNN